MWDDEELYMKDQEIGPEDAPDPTPPPRECIWRQSEDGDQWETGCGNLAYVEDDSPGQNGMKYCWYCGKSLKESVYFDEDKDEDESDPEGAGPDDNKAGREFENRNP